MEGSFLGVGTMPRLERDTWCTVKWLRGKQQMSTPPGGVPWGYLAEMLFHEKTAVSTDTRDVYSRTAIATDARQIPVKGN